MTYSLERLISFSRLIVICLLWIDYSCHDAKLHKTTGHNDCCVIKMQAANQFRNAYILKTMK